ncbi:pseudouridine synthase [Corallococcus silvisoli]|uniref:pseudouridine synthase n=1 Tax=Corallococcus silvisoli TaxID=2697031 RepID=UPI0013788F09|nr:pseudouridine synthase [Corallococcus silvisoli]NBD11100.1 pseudouridine synthase [Corallococcus silvisoli]
MAAERLQKYLARAGVASRRHAEELITSGRVGVNNETVTELGSRVEPGTDLVTVDGKLVTPPEESSYYLLYKPVGVVTTLSDPQGRPTVASYVEETGRRLFPVGRLDYDAEGALLFTDDGALAHKLTHPSFQVPRTYLAKVKGVPDMPTLEKLRGGVRLEDGMATPVSVDIFEKAERNTWLKIVVAEGRPHLIKRLCAAVGHPVVRLFRPAYAGVGVEGLRPGELRPLKVAEVNQLNEVADGRAQPSAAELRLPPRRHGRHAPGFNGADDDEAELSMDDDAPVAPRKAERADKKPASGVKTREARPERKDWKGVQDGGTRPPKFAKRGATLATDDDADLDADVPSFDDDGEEMTESDAAEGATYGKAARGAGRFSKPEGERAPRGASRGGKPAGGAEGGAPRGGGRFGKPAGGDAAGARGGGRFGKPAGRFGDEGGARGGARFGKPAGAGRGGDEAPRGRFGKPAGAGRDGDEAPRGRFGKPAGAAARGPSRFGSDEGGARGGARFGKPAGAGRGGDEGGARGGGRFGKPAGRFGDEGGARGGGARFGKPAGRFGSDEGGARGGGARFGKPAGRFGSDEGGARGGGARFGKPAGRFGSDEGAPRGGGRFGKPAGAGRSGDDSAPRGRFSKPGGDESPRRGGFGKPAGGARFGDEGGARRGGFGKPAGRFGSDEGGARGGARFGKPAGRFGDEGGAPRGRFGKPAGRGGDEGGAPRGGARFGKPAGGARFGGDEGGARGGARFGKPAGGARFGKPAGRFGSDEGGARGGARFGKPAGAGGASRGEGRPERREWKPRGESAGGAGRPERREWKPRAEGSGSRGASRGGGEPSASASGERIVRAGVKKAPPGEGASFKDWKERKTRDSEPRWNSKAPRGAAGRPAPRGGPRRPR